MAETLGTKMFDVKNYGAIGDGSPHPLSEIFSTLAQAQGQYPRASSLNESFDWHGHQAAIDAALAAGGGTVYTPRGRYKMNGPKALTFPLFSDRLPAPNPTASSAQVNWLGDGNEISVVEWTTDKGTTRNDNYAVMCGSVAGDPSNQQTNSRYGNNAMSAGWFRDLALVGPALTLLSANNTLGSAGCNMSGICWAARRALDRVRVSWFYAGIDVVGDHTTWQGVKLFCNYYGIYLNHNSPTMYGDMAIEQKTSVENSRMACIGLHYGGSMGNWHWSGRPFLGQSPYVFFKEATPLVNGTPSIPQNYSEQVAIMAGCQFDALFTEGVGNAVWWDENLSVNGAARALIDRCAFQSLTLPLWSDARRLNGRDRCIMQVAKLNGGGLYNITRMDVVAPTRPLFDVSVSILGDFLIEGDIEAFIVACEAAGQPPVRPPSDLAARRFRFRHNHGDGNCGPWAGRVYRVENTFGVTKNDVVGGLFHGCRPIAAADTTRPFYGIARSTGATSNPATNGYAYVLVAEEGLEIPVKTAEPATAQSLKKIAATTGAVTDGASVDDERVIGYASYPGGRINLIT